MELFILLVTALGALGSAPPDSVEESPDVQTLPGRMERVERLLQQQTLALARQQNMILRLQSQLSQQDVTLTHQENMILRLQSQLSQQDVTLTHQENMILRLQSQLSQQDVTLTRQHQVLSGYAHVFGQLNAGLLSEQKGRLLQDAILQQLPDWNGTSQRSTSQPDSPTTADDVNGARSAAARDVKSRSDDVTGARNAEARDVTSRSDDVTRARNAEARDVTSRSDDVTRERNAEARVVMGRSDDAGPLEAVVNRVSQQVTEMGAELQALKAQTAADIHTLQTQASQHSADLQDARTSSFVHWGSASCGGNASQLVYSGVMGGSLYTTPGSASNYLCITLAPVAGDDKPSAGAQAHLYGGEYETHDAHFDKDPVCSVCRPSFATTVMIPGTNVCTAGWTTQYAGYLMAGRYAHAAASEFICVDSRLESRMGSDQDNDGKLLYYTKTVCGSLPCQPYVNDKTVTCAVCSK